MSQLFPLYSKNESCIHKRVIENEWSDKQNKQQKKPLPHAFYELFPQLTISFFIYGKTAMKEVECNQNKYLFWLQRKRNISMV